MADDTRIDIDLVAVDNKASASLKFSEQQLININIQLGKAQKLASSLNGAFKQFQKTGQLTSKVTQLQKQQGDLSVFKLAKKNVAKETMLGNAHYGSTRDKSLLLAKQQADYDKEAKLRLGITPQPKIPKLQFGDSGYKEQRKAELSLQNQKKLLDENLKKQIGIKNAANVFASNIAKAVLSFSAIKKAVGFMSTSLKKSADWTENLNLFEVTFGKASADTMDFALNVQKAYGIAANEIIRYTGLFKQMSEAIGIAEKTSTEMSKTLTTLGYDIASLYNISTEKAMEKLQAGIAGQTKPLRQLGMDITAQSLDKYLGDMGLDYTSKMLNQADKMLLRTIVIVDQAKNTYGDMAKTINTFANQVKVLSGASENFKMAVGDLIIGPATTAITYLNGFMIAMTNIIRAFVPLSKTSGLNDTVESIGKIDEATQDLEKTMGLLSFDKFESLSNGDGGASGINGMLTDEFAKKQAEYMEEFNKQMETIKNKANEIAKSIQSWIFPNITYKEDGSIDTLGKINEIIIGIVSTIGTLIGMKIASFIEILVGKLIILKTTTDAVSLSTKLFGLAQNALMLGGIFLLINSIVQLTTNWDNLSTTMKAVYIVLGVVGAAFITFSTLSKIATAASTTFTSALKLQKIAAIGLATAGILVLAAGIATLVANWDNMGSWQKVITIFASLAASATAAAIAFGIFHASATMGIGAAAIVGGITLVTGSILAANSAEKFAQGGYPDRGQMFIANERGAELVGNIGGQTAVANNDMIVQAIEEAAYRGYIRAIQETQQESGGNQNINLQLDINGRAFARATYPDYQAEGKRRGY